VAPTDEHNPTYKKLFPTARVIYGYDHKIVTKYLEFDKGAVVFDDCFYSKPDGKLLGRILDNEKYSTKMILCSMQYPIELDYGTRGHLFIYFYLMTSFYLRVKSYMIFYEE
jgi:hypothetical protein